ncbi:hypothetical protein MZJ31_004455 [Vibrio parahaemolyticus]|uniref:hypothetical protein n=1 Tax=Vibrio parahaemolyticus TaxID=670 RepID=UPI0003590BDB|nr:hypothetical protein [Vibrio parahaemolyticus]PWF65663.1 hypothetical protein CCD93_22975 [Vibrio sp. T21]AGQ92232.1 hypothetical protein M634_10765 [Vibrio parahaemolyticus O1:Kuk str. FDA_R31]EGQ7683551.1 hypothetical protein [Vibrio parahaemolyticus]EGQ7826139.1 hypothetical protein [Vibrio parahaemolyticus]EGQ8084360.1 hypothetical protein [Vibrio parahaemolyticus]
MNRFMLSDKTLLDSESAEYFWVNWMLSEGYSAYKIKSFLMKAFGGDEQIAEAMLDVVKGNKSKCALISLIHQKHLEATEL